ncbi:MAG: metallophosphoesterase family protein [Candidatus Berkelbacteria bacterium]|nr:metallophosphoesterase family protein [Candidatus Berkelbacteria bacterium]
MKTILISDLHGQEKTLLYLKKIIDREKPQALICSGDITSFGETGFLDRFFKILEDSRLQGFLIWGNSDSEEIQERMRKSQYNSHLVSRNLEGERVFGVSLTEEPIKINGADIKGAILITHGPPLKAMIDRKYENAPRYHISGHLHRLRWVKKYPSTIHIQVPTLQGGEYATLSFAPFEVEFCSIL